MNFEPGEDLSLFLAAIDRIAAPYAKSWTPGGQRFEHSPALEKELLDGGFLSCAQEPSLGVVAAAAMVFRIAQLNVCAEVAASAILAPSVCPDRHGPLAVVWGRPARPVRFIAQARTVVHLDGAGVRMAPLRPGDATPVESAFAYPMGTLAQPEALSWQAPVGVRADTALDLWRIAIAAELLGCLQAGLDAVVEHVSDRRQFGRPLGSFQALQHRLASAASEIQGGRWMMLRAADSRDTVDAAAAAGHAQAISTRIVYDLHQFMGAMGLTLEHPLHRWTYRARLLHSELGGESRQFTDLAAKVWACAPR
jgi:hypothetical protein